VAVTVYQLTFSGSFLCYCLIACQPVDQSTGPTQGGTVSSTSWGPHENRDRLIFLVLAHLICSSEKAVKRLCCCFVIEGVTAPWCSTS